MYACIESRREDVVRQLVKREEIDPNIRDNEGNTAIIHAVHAGEALESHDAREGIGLQR